MQPYLGYLAGLQTHPAVGVCVCVDIRPMVPRHLNFDESFFCCLFFCVIEYFFEFWYFAVAFLVFRFFLL